MSNINLLPWRKEAKKRKERAFWMAMLVCSVFTLGGGLLVDQFIEHEVKLQHHRNQFLTTEIARLDATIGEIRKLRQEKAALEERIQLIKQLQARRNLATQLLNIFPELVVPGIFLARVDFDDSKVKVQGKSEANSRLAEMMRNIERVPWLGHTSLSSIVASDDKPLSLSRFDMQFDITLFEGAGQGKAKAKAKAKGGRSELAAAK